LPCAIADEKDWGFTFQELYEGVAGVHYYAEEKDSNDDAAAKNYRNRLWGQTALVTGANSGTGYEISLALARLGVSVTMACRNPTKCQAAAQKIEQDELVVERGKKDRGYTTSSIMIATMTVDTSSLKSVRNFCNEFLERTDDGDGAPMPLDMLFLNAGIGAPSPTADGEGGYSLHLSEDGIENLFATNVVGHHLMYKLLEPSIRRSDDLRAVPPRIVLTSSCRSYDTRYPYKVATDLETLNGVPAVDPSLYEQSKLAQILWAKELTAKLDDAENNNDTKEDNMDPNSIVYVNAAHPGVVATNIWDKVQWEIYPYGKIAEFVINSIKSLMWTSEEGALTLIYLGTAVKQLQQDNIRGQYFHPQSKLIENHKFAMDNDKQTKVLQEKLWKFLDELVADFV
jgi:NAD(P)-dependent dehydrogenase (short-subunit alcohol dehydrogenase family)